MSVQHIGNVCLLSTQPPDSFTYRQVSFSSPVLFKALPSAYPDFSIGSDTPRERIDEGRLADTGLSGNKNDLTFSSEHLLKPVLQLCQHFIATNKSSR